MTVRRFNFDNEVTRMEERHDQEMRALSHRRELVRLAHKLCEEFDQEDYDLRIGTAVGYWTHDSTVIDFHLKAQQGIDLVTPLLKAISKTGLFRHPQHRDYLEIHYVGWEFTERAQSATKGKNLLVRVWFLGSTVCRLVPTGETTQIMKVECTNGEERSDENQDNRDGRY